MYLSKIFALLLFENPTLVSLFSENSKATKNWDFHFSLFKKTDSE